MTSETLALTQAQDDQVRLILADFKDGLDSIFKAGERLVRLQKEIPGINRWISDKYPLLTDGVLRTLEMVGRKRWHPLILIYSVQEQRSLRALSYDEQEQLLFHKVPVHVLVQGENGVHETAYIAYADMTTWQRLQHVREGRVVPPSEVRAKLLEAPRAPKSDLLKTYKLDADGHITWNPEVKWTIDLATATLAEIVRLHGKRKSRRKYSRNKT